MATKINARSTSSNCSVGAVIDNGDGLKINVNASWYYTVSAPTNINVHCSYDAAGQSFADDRSYDSTGSYDTTGKIPCGVFDTTFNDALKALILDCFENYTNVNLIGEE